MAHKLAIEAPRETFALGAIVAVVTPLLATNLPRGGPAGRQLQPAVLQILGADDPLIPIGGGAGVVRWNNSCSKNVQQLLWHHFL